MKCLAIVGLLMTCMLGSVRAQIDVSKLITGNQPSPEAIASIHYGPEGKLIWIFDHAPSARGRHIFDGAGALQPDGSGADTELHINGQPICVNCCDMILGRPPTKKADSGQEPAHDPPR